MVSIEKFPSEIIEKLAKLFGDTENGFTGSEIGRLLTECNIPDPNPLITKWKRLDEAFQFIQNQNNSSNNIIQFIKKAMSPVSYIENQEVYLGRLDRCNKILGFVGLNLGKDNQIRKITKTESLSELEIKAKRLYDKLKDRDIHQYILNLCKPELLADNYFHAVFEGVKTIADKIRILTGLSEDGSELIEKTFSSKAPYLLINNFKTETEKSEHTGFSNLLKGIFGVFRNTTSHELKYKREITEQDALDLFPILSYIHRRLDKSIRTGI